MVRQVSMSGLVVLAVLALFVCRAYADTLTVGIREDIISVDPARAQRHRETDMVLGLLYEPLVRIQDGKYVPGIASGLQRVTDTRWEITIVPNGAVNADEIAGALRRGFAPGGLEGLSAPSRDRLQLQDARADGDGVVVIDLEQPVPRIHTVLGQEYIALPRGGEMVGTGPYRLERWDRGNRIVLTKRGSIDHELPDRLVLEVIPSATERVRLLRLGIIDAALAVPAAEAPELARAGFGLRAVPKSRTYFIEFNTQRPPFHDPRVRRALNLATDVEGMLRSVYRGIGLPVPTIVSPDTVGFHHELEPIGYNIAEARRLLQEAGYPHGFAFELDVVPHRAAEVRAYAAMWREIGVEAHLRVWPDWQTLRDALLKGTRIAWTAEWDNTSRDPASVLGAKAGAGGTANYGGYDHPMVGRLLEQAARAHDPDHRLDLFRAVQAILLDDAAFLFGYVEEEVIAYRPRAGDYVAALYGGRKIDFANAGGF